MGLDMKYCVILAGGKSSRMGRDKTLLPFAKEPSMTHFLVQKMQRIFKHVYVSTKEQKFNPPLEILMDETNDFSPMLALYSVLKRFNESVFIVPADMPFVSYKCITQLAKFKDEFDIVVAKDKDYKHSLCGFFSPKIAKFTKELYEKKEHKIGLLFNFCKYKYVEFDDCEQFMNINNPDEYKRALNEI